MDEMLFYVGQHEEIVRTITREEVLKYAYLTEDMNPIHIDPEAAQKSIFGKQVVHGMFCASLISGILGMKMPGKGTIYVSQYVEFVSPVYLGDTVRVSVEIIEMLEKRKAKCSTIIYNQDNKIVLNGYAIVKLPKERI